MRVPAATAFWCLVVFNAVKVGIATAVVAGFSVPMFAYKTVTGCGWCLLLWFAVFRWGGRWAEILTWLLQTIILGTHLLYHSSFGTHLSLAVAGRLFGEALEVLRRGAVPWDGWVVLIVAADIPFVLLASVQRDRVRQTLRRSSDRLAILTAALVLVSASGPALFWLRGESIPFLVHDRWSGATRIVKRYGLLAAHGTELIRTLSGSSPADALQPGPERRWSRRPGARPDIMIVQLESVGANVIGLRHNGELVAPFVSRLAEESTYYPFTVTYHAAGGSSDAEFAALNGAEPLLRFPSLKIPGYGFPDSFVHCLAQDGYATLAFHGNYGSFYNRDVAFRAMGFHRFFDVEELRLPHAEWGAPDATLFTAVLERLEQWPSPVFAYVITMTSHEPYHFLPANEAPARFRDAQPEIVGDFMASIAYLDRQLEWFLTAVRELRPGVWIVLFGDHTPFILDTGYSTARVELEDFSAELVPLIIDGPYDVAYRENEKAASLVDIGPTLIELSGVECSVRSWGTNLMSVPVTAELLPKDGALRDRRQVFAAAAGHTQ